MKAPVKPSDVVSIETLQTEDDRFRRIVKKDGTVLYLPSVTTIFQHVKVDSFFLDNWKEEQSERLGMLGKRLQLFLDAERGKAVHSALEKWGKGTDLDWMKDKYTTEEWARIHRYMQWEQERKPSFVHNELEVFSEKWKFSGQTDGIVEFKSMDEDGDAVHDFYIIDFKTGKDIYETHKLQGAAYLMAYEEMFPKCHLKGVIILALNARTKKGWKECILEGDDLGYYKEGFKLHAKLFTWSRPDFEPEMELLPAKYCHAKV